MAARRVGVVGGGIAGLVAALELADRGAAVSVLEATGRWGGQLRSRRTGGLLVEEGAEGFAASSPVLEDLVRRLGLEDQLLPQAVRTSLLLTGGGLEPAPPGAAAERLGIRPAGGESDGLVTLAGGMAALATAAHEALAGRADCRRDTRVARLTREDAAWRMATADDVLSADDVLVTAPPGPAADLVGPLLPDAAAALRQLPRRSSLTVMLTWPREHVAHPLDGTGFVTDAPGADDAVACTFMHAKYPHRAPSDRVLLRTFFRPDTPEAMHADDTVWIRRAHEVLAEVLGIATPPDAAWVTRWPDALPQHGPAYRDQVDAIEAMLEELPGFHLAGAGYHGPGIDGAVRSARDAAKRLMD